MRNEENENGKGDHHRRKNENENARKEKRKRKRFFFLFVCLFVFPRCFEPCKSTVKVLSCQVLCYGSLPTIAVREQLFLVVEQLLVRLRRELGVRALNDRIHRTGLLAEAAIYALCGVA